MLYNDHSKYRDKHAFLSPSSSHWLRYDDQKLEARFHSFSSARRGTDIHNLAHECIRLKIKLDPAHLATAEYVSDGIELGMNCEQALFYSPNCFGHADTLSFDGAVLRIHDLKTGSTKVTMEQLKVYAAIFCLEYEVDPRDIIIELRVYQRDQIIEDTPEPDNIQDIMDRIVYSDSFVSALREAQ